jgi:hypothetical protein
MIDKENESLQMQLLAASSLVADGGNKVMK